MFSNAFKKVSSENESAVIRMRPWNNKYLLLKLVVTKHPAERILDLHYREIRFEGCVDYTGGLSKSSSNNSQQKYYS